MNDQMHDGDPAPVTAPEMGGSELGWPPTAYVPPAVPPHGAESMPPDPHAPTDPTTPTDRPTSSTGAGAPRGMMFVGGLVVLAIGALMAGMALGGRTPAPSPDFSAPGTGAGDSVPAGGVPAGGATGSGGGATGSAGSTAGDTGGVSTGLVIPGRASLGEAAPPFTLETPDGGQLSLADFAGRPIVLNFWATWCRPCAVEMPYLQMAHAQYGDTATYGDAALAVIAVDVGEMTSVVKPWLEERGLTFPVALDLNSTVANQYRVFAYPTTYLIDRDGRIINIRRGAFANQFDLNQGIGLIMPEMKE